MPIVTVSGKGGVGKTTITALLVQEMLALGADTPILVVDGDPARTLHLALGIAAPERTLADLRDDLQTALRDRRNMGEVAALLDAAGMVVQVTPQLHFLTMGRGEGPGCFCQVNVALSAALRAFLPRYPWIVVDNEAGIEHLARVRIAQVDAFLVVVQPDARSQSVATTLVQAARETAVQIGRLGLVVNRDHGRGGLQVPLDIPLWAAIPDDPTLRLHPDEPVAKLLAKSPARQGAHDLAQRVLNGQGEKPCA